MAIRIRNLKIGDLEYRVSLLNNPIISSHLNVDEVFDLKRTLGWYEVASRSETRFDVVIEDGNKSVGMAGLVQISKLNRSAEAYIYIDPKFQGKHYGFNGLKLLINYAFQELLLNKVFVYTFAENKKANLFYEKLGFRQEGFLKEHTFHNGELKDRCIYSIFKSDVV